MTTPAMLQRLRGLAGRRLWLAAIAMALLAGGYAHGLWLWRRVQREGDEVHQALAAARASKAFQAPLPFRVELVPATRRSEIRSSVQHVADQFQVTVVSLSEQGMKPGPEPGYQFVGLTLTVEGEYAAVGKFLQAIETIPLTIVRPSALSMQREESLLPKIRAQVTLECLVTS